MIPRTSNDEIPIGVASMDEAGVIHLRLRMEGEGAIGDGYLSYAPDDPNYREILDHVGGLKPGEYKSIPPWPFEEKDTQLDKIVNDYADQSYSSGIDCT